MVFNYGHFHFFFSFFFFLQTEGVGEGTGRVGVRSAGKLFQRFFLLEEILPLIIGAGEEEDIRRI